MIAPRRIALLLLLAAGCTWTGSTPVESPPAEAVAPVAVESPLPVEAPAESVKPGINERFLSPDLDVDRYVGIFEGESREIARQRERILGELRLREGMRVADVGAGTGLFLEPFSRAVGEAGRLYAVEISARFIELLEQRAAELGLENFAATLCSERDVRLAAESVDLVFVCDTYHHFEYPGETLESIRRALRPGGSMVVIDFERIPGVSREWTLEHVRLGKAEVIAEITAAGFELVEEHEAGLEENYMLRFRRP